jgi:acyl-CoA synthetase (AMP-forming)/AMP-acid ligase II
MSSPELIHHFLERSAAKFPDKVALVHGDRRATYSQINGQANALAGYLLNRGLRTGDRVVLLLENSLEYVVGYYGALKAGAVICPLISDLKADSLNPILKKLEPQFIISSIKYGKILSDADLKGSGVREVILKKISEKPGWRDTVLTDLDEIISLPGTEDIALNGKQNDPASIIFTSGSTGGPKGVILTHGNVVANTISICRYLNLSDRDIQMVVLPFFYVMGKSLLNTHFAVGGTVVINNRFAFPVTVLEEMVREEVTGFSGVPSTYAYLLHRSPLAAYRDKLGSLRYCSQAGGHMARSIKEALRRVLPDHTSIYIMYGATEAAARLSYLDPDHYLDKMDSIGRAIPGVVLRVVDESGNAAPAGRLGELAARGENIMAGYWSDTEATDKVLKNGWYFTGDQAYRDAEGYFFVTGRNDDIIKVGGHRVNPKEIEDILMSSGGLLEVVVLGLADPLLGNRLVALAVPKDGAQEKNKILSACAEKLPRFKLPADLVFTKSLPKKLNGKIDRGEALKLLSKKD